jgi:hypothetical protein
MPALAQYFEVVAVDQRSIGLSGTPRTGTTPVPSSATWCGRADGRARSSRLARVSSDTGVPIGYAVFPLPGWKLPRHETAA